MAEYRVRVVDVTERWATVTCKSPEAAKRMALASLGMAEEHDDEDLDDVEWDWPTPMNGLAAWVDDVREQKGV